MWGEERLSVLVAFYGEGAIRLLLLCMSRLAAGNGMGWNGGTIWLLFVGVGGISGWEAIYPIA
jgi:hypothetical protein